VFFPPIFFDFTMVINFCQERNTFCIETCFFQVFHQRNHCSRRHINLLQTGLWTWKISKRGTLNIPILPPQQNKLFYKLHHVGFIKPSIILCNESLIRGTNLNVNASGVFGQTWCTIYAFVHPAICN
jgi:hypothetical protein